MSASGMPPFPPAVPPQNAYYGDPGGGFVPPPQVIAHDQPCRKCGYNLRGLSTASRCPECGTPVGFSYHGDLLRFCDPGWVETLYKGARTFVIGIAVIFIGSIVIGVAAAGTGSPGLALLLSGAVLIGWALTLVGWWLLTEPDPSGLGEDKYGTARQIIRVSLIVGIVQQGLQMLSQHAILNPTAMIGVQVVSLVCGLVGVVGFFAQLNYLKKIARRIPDAKLSNRANTVMYGLSISYGLLILVGIGLGLMIRVGGRNPGSSLAGFGCFMGIIGIAVFIFLIMYLLLVEKMGKRFKAEAQAARSTWASAAFAQPGAPA